MKIRAWHSEIIQNNKVRLTTNVSTGKLSMEARWNVYKQVLYILVKWIKLNSISRIDFRGILGDVALFRRSFTKRIKPFQNILNWIDLG